MPGHPIFARLYSRRAPQTEVAGAAAHRDQLLAGLTGRVLEVGAGGGLSFSHYPTTVTEVVAVEPEPYFRRAAVEAAPTAPVPVQVVDGDADHLPAESGSFDAVVFALVLCSVPDLHRALREAHRVLVPDGELRFYEHVRSESPRYARAQDRIDWVWSHAAGGCHANRRTEAAIADAGFRIDRIDRFEFRPHPVAPPLSPHILGAASRI